MNVILPILFILFTASNSSISIKQDAKVMSSKKSKTQSEKVEEEGITSQAENMVKRDTEAAARDKLDTEDSFMLPKDYYKQPVQVNDERMESESEYSNADEAEEEVGDESIFSNANSETIGQFTDVQDIEEEDFKFPSQKSSLAEQDTKNREDDNVDVSKEVLLNRSMKPKGTMLNEYCPQSDRKATLNYGHRNAPKKTSKSQTDNCRVNPTVEGVENMEEERVEHKNPESAHKYNEVQRTQIKELGEFSGKTEADDLPRSYSKPKTVNQNGNRLKAESKEIKSKSIFDIESQHPAPENHKQNENSRNQFEDMKVTNTKNDADTETDVLDDKNLWDHKKSASAGMIIHKGQSINMPVNKESDEVRNEYFKPDENARPAYNKWAKNVKVNKNTKCEGDETCPNRREQCDNKHHYKTDSSSQDSDSLIFQHPIPEEENERTQRPVTNSSRKMPPYYDSLSSAKGEAVEEERKFSKVESSNKHSPADEDSVMPITDAVPLEHSNFLQNRFPDRNSGILQSDKSPALSGQRDTVETESTGRSNKANRKPKIGDEFREDNRVPFTGPARVTQKELDESEFEKREGNNVNIHEPQNLLRTFDGISLKKNSGNTEYDELNGSNFKAAESRLGSVKDKNGKYKTVSGDMEKVSEDAGSEAMKVTHHKTISGDRKRIEGGHKSKFFPSLMLARKADNWDESSGNAPKEVQLKSKLKALGDMLHSDHKVPPYLSEKGDKDEYNDNEKESEDLKQNAEPDPVKDWWDLLMEPKEGNSVPMRPLKKIEQIQRMIEQPARFVFKKPIQHSKKPPSLTVADDNRRSNGPPSPETRKKLDEFIKKLKMTGELYCLHNKDHSDHLKFNSHDRFNGKKSYDMKKYFFNDDY